MGKKREKSQSKTLPSSPTHALSSSSSSSSSDFEFTISLSTRTSSFSADELFYKGKLLPLHLSPRISMLRFLSSSDTSSATDDDDRLRRPKKKYFSLARISSVFKNKNKENDAAVKRTGSSARELIRKYLNKVKPLYDKVSKSSFLYTNNKKSPADVASHRSRVTCGYFNHSSFSGSLTSGGHVASCPSSTRSSPTPSGLLSRNIINTGAYYSNTTSSMEELQSAIQGAIAHCKNSLLQNPQPDPVN